MTRLGYRGYIGSRHYQGQRAPQHVQNLVIRNYCQKNGMTYLLSATEYAMEGCFVMLNDVLNELPKLEGIVLYSLYMLPSGPAERRHIWNRVLDQGASLHGAVEDWAVRSKADVAKVEDLWMITHTMRHAADPQGLPL